MLGQQVNKLLLEKQNAGEHNKSFYLGDLERNIYLLQIIINDEKYNHKIILINEE